MHWSWLADSYLLHVDKPHSLVSRLPLLTKVSEHVRGQELRGRAHHTKFSHWRHTESICVALWRTEDLCVRVSVCLSMSLCGLYTAHVWLVTAWPSRSLLCRFWQSQPQRSWNSLLAVVQADDSPGSCSAESEATDCSHLCRTNRRASLYVTRLSAFQWHCLQKC